MVVVDLLKTITENTRALALDRPVALGLALVLRRTPVLGPVRAPILGPESRVTQTPKQERAHPAVAQELGLALVQQAQAVGLGMLQAADPLELAQVRMETLGQIHKGNKI